MHASAAMYKTRRPRYHSAMTDYQKEFIDFTVSCGALAFGSFRLKSGRSSPFFINAGAYVTGSQLLHLGKFYAKAIHDNFGDDFDVLFGPAYKGIPLGVATAIAYDELYGKSVRYSSNRKEAKDHGEKGILLGGKISDGDKVLIIEDVTTSGKSIEETYPIIKAQSEKASVIGLVVSINRMEKGLTSDKSALDEISASYGFPARAIVSMDDVIDALYTHGDRTIITDDIKKSLDDYYARWGAKH